MKSYPMNKQYILYITHTHTYTDYIRLATKSSVHHNRYDRQRNESVFYMLFISYRINFDNIFVRVKCAACIVYRIHKHSHTHTPSQQKNKSICIKSGFSTRTFFHSCLVSRRGFGDAKSRLMEISSVYYYFNFGSVCWSHFSLSILYIRYIIPYCCMYSVYIYIYIVQTHREYF